MDQIELYLSNPTPKKKFFCDSKILNSEVEKESSFLKCSKSMSLYPSFFFSDFPTPERQKNSDLLKYKDQILGSTTSFHSFHHTSMVWSERKGR